MDTKFPPPPRHPAASPPPPQYTTAPPQPHYGSIPPPPSTPHPQPFHSYAPDPAWGHHPSAPRGKYGNVFLYILAIFLPPVPVFLKVGCGCEILINIILWALCWIPGVLHAMFVIATHP